MLEIAGWSHVPERTRWEATDLLFVARESVPQGFGNIPLSIRILHQVTPFRVTHKGRHIHAPIRRPVKDASDRGLLAGIQGTFIAERKPLRASTPIGCRAILPAITR
eukprot:8498619-Pyramimonas_sp.AAC.1